MMKIKVFMMLPFLALMCAGAQAASLNDAGSKGFGVEFGQPTGVTGKYWLSNMSAADAALGYHFNHNFDMHMDYLVHAYILNGGSQGMLPLYVGIGGRILAGDDTQFGLRLPLGISYLLSADKLEIFAEVAPVVDLTDIGADIDGTVGVRLYIF